MLGIYHHSQYQNYTLNELNDIAVNDRDNDLAIAILNEVDSKIEYEKAECLELLNEILRDGIENNDISLPCNVNDFAITCNYINIYCDNKVENAILLAQFLNNPNNHEWSQENNVHYFCDFDTNNYNNQVVKLIANPNKQYELIVDDSHKISKYKIVARSVVNAKKQTVKILQDLLYDNNLKLILI